MLSRCKQEYIVIRMQAKLTKQFLKLVKNRALMSIGLLAVLVFIIILSSTNNDQHPNITTNKPMTSENSLATGQTPDAVLNSNIVSAPTQSSPSSSFTKSTPSTSSQGSISTNSKYVYKPYVSSVCTKTPIPYKTSYTNASFLPVGETTTVGGTDGYTQTCTADSTGYKPLDITVKSNDKTVWVGTKVAYVASVCTKITIPYQTNYEYVTWLYVGETQSYGGTDGYTNTCTTDSSGYKPIDFTIQPYNKTVYAGTTAAPPTQAQIDAARAEKIASCIRYLGSKGASGAACYQIR